MVDVVRLSPMGLDTLTLIDDFRANEQSTIRHPLADGHQCNGYWHNLAGLDIR